MAADDPTRPLDWSASEARTAEMVERMNVAEPVSAGDGLGMNNSALENLGANSSANQSGGSAGTVNVLLNFDGTLRWVNVNANSLQDVP